MHERPGEDGQGGRGAEAKAKNVAKANENQVESQRVKKNAASAQSGTESSGDWLISWHHRKKLPISSMSVKAMSKDHDFIAQPSARHIYL